MKNLIINNTINNIQKYYKYDDIKLKEIKYGLETLYLTIFKTIVVFIISALINTTKELLLIFIFYGLLRLTGFGLYAKRSIDCCISSLILFVGIPVLCKKLTIDINMASTILMIALILLFIYAPADTEKRPLINKKKRIIYKLLTSITTIVYIFIINLTKNITLQNTLFFSILIETLLVLPISYKLFGLKYNNYKNYKKGERK